MLGRGELLDGGGGIDSPVVTVIGSGKSEGALGGTDDGV
jgi:hypothetical protein